MPTDKDLEQDVLIRQNAEHIRRNEEAILRQTAALEKIRDHYFPRKSIGKRVLTFLVKVVGAVTVGAGILETADWYWNTRQRIQMARQSATVAKRLFFGENDAAGAAKFLERALELNEDQVEYRIALNYVRGIAAISDLFDVGRPLLNAERERVDAILSEAVYLMEVAPDEPMPHVLAAQAQMLRGEKDAAVSSSERAIEIAPANVQARVTACAMRFASGDVAAARRHLAEAERIKADFPLVLFWKSHLALSVDRDPKSAKVFADALLERAPRLPMAHVQAGVVLTSLGEVGAARASFERALALSPSMTRAMVLLSGTYSREGNGVLARLWLDRALEQDPNCMAALVARGTAEDLSKALVLAPFRADLYRLRAAVRQASGDASAAEDLKTAEALEKDTKHE